MRISSDSLSLRFKNIVKERYGMTPENISLLKPEHLKGYMKNTRYKSGDRELTTRSEYSNKDKVS